MKHYFLFVYEPLYYSNHVLLLAEHHL
ncbi:hypothetical protein IIE_06022, partial [Bacillus cereus VD045]